MVFATLGRPEDGPLLVGHPSEQHSVRRGLPEVAQNYLSRIGASGARLRDGLRAAFEAAEGPIDVTHCIMKDRACGEGVHCVMYEAWEKGQRVTLEYLATQTLADFVFVSLRGRCLLQVRAKPR